MLYNFSLGWSSA